MLRHCDLAPVFLRVFGVEGFGLRVRSHGLLVRVSFGHFFIFLSTGTALALFSLPAPEDHTGQCLSFMGFKVGEN